MLSVSLGLTSCGFLKLSKLNEMAQVSLPQPVNILSPIKDGLKISSLAKNAVPVSGTCSQIGSSVVITGAVVATSNCQNDGTWAAILDFSTVPDGVVSIQAVQKNAGGTSNPVTRSFNKSSAICDDPSSIIAAPFALGSGTVLDPYIVCTGTQLSQIRFNLAANLKLENDIDMQSSSWNQVGTFSGIFDGNGFVIKNLNYSTTGNPTGFISVLSGTITNLGLVDINFMGYCHMGGLVGIANIGSVISNTYVTGDIGHTNMTINNDAVGGLVGYNSGVISNSFAGGSVTGDATSNTYGGLVGRNTGTGNVQNSYSIGSVTGVAPVGGLIAENFGTVTGSYWNKTLSGLSTSAGGTGLTDSEMQEQGSFPVWDFVTPIWKIDPTVSIYPILAWQ